MAKYREWDISCKVYVGNLGNNASKNEIEAAFGKYGPLRNVWVARNPPGFAFVEFEDPRDAEDSVRGLDGTRCCGTRIRVEMSSGRSRRGAAGGSRGGGGGAGGGGGGFGRRYSRRVSRRPHLNIRQAQMQPVIHRLNLPVLNKSTNNISISNTTMSPRRRSYSRSRSRSYDRRSRSYSNGR